MSQTFEFKPAPIARPVRVEVEPGGALLRGANGAVRDRLEFSAAQRLRFAELSGRGVTSRWFDVEHGAGRFRVACNSSSGDDPRTGHLAQYRAAVRAILLGVEARVPGLEVELGAGRGARLAMFSIGACSALFGAALLVAALATGADASKVLAGLLPTGLMGLVGVVLMRRFRPWVPGPRVPLAQLVEALTPAGGGDAGPRRGDGRA